MTNDPRDEIADANDRARGAACDLEAEGRAILASLQRADELVEFAMRANLDDPDDAEALVNLAYSYKKIRTQHETRRG